MKSALYALLAFTLTLVVIAALTVITGTPGPAPDHTDLDATSDHTNDSKPTNSTPQEPSPQQKEAPPVRVVAGVRISRATTFALEDHTA